METSESYKQTPKKDGQDAEEKKIHLDFTKFGQKTDKDSLPIKPSQNSASNGMINEEVFKIRPTKNSGPDAESESILSKTKNAEQKSGKDLPFIAGLPNNAVNGKKQLEQFQRIQPEKDPKKPIVKELPNAVKSEKGDKEEYQQNPNKEHKK